MNQFNISCMKNLFPFIMGYEMCTFYFKHFVQTFTQPFCLNINL